MSQMNQMLNLEGINTPALSDSILVRYIVAVLSAWTAETVTYPLDLTKTRLQVQNEIASSKYGFKMEHNGMFMTALKIVKHEGVFNLWSGMLAIWQRHAVYAGCQHMIYERLRRSLMRDDGTISFSTATVCGITAGGLAQLIASPTDLVKVQLQTEGRRLRQGKPPRIKGTAVGRPGSIALYKQIYKESGIKGFWRGALPNMQRAALVTVGNMSMYDYSKTLLIKKFAIPDNAYLHTCSAFMSGFVATFLSIPADVVKTRLMNQPVGPDGRGLLYKGSIDCLKQSVKNEGILALYKGFFPVWIRLGPWALINWLMFEEIIFSLGGKTF